MQKNNPSIASQTMQLLPLLVSEEWLQEQDLKVVQEDHSFMLSMCVHECTCMWGYVQVQIHGAYMCACVCRG